MAWVEPGLEAGQQAARLTGHEPVESQPPVAGPETIFSIEALWELPCVDKQRPAFLDFQNDVTAEDVRLALRENYASVELVKRYTTAGRGAVKELHAAITPVSDSYRIFRVSGVDARAVLTQGTAVDLHPGSLSPGQCARTSLGKTGVLLHQLDDVPSYDVYAWRSYAEYLSLWLDRAMGTDISSTDISSLP